MKLPTFFKLWDVSDISDCQTWMCNEINLLLNEISQHYWQGYFIDKKFITVHYHWLTHWGWVLKVLIIWVSKLCHYCLRQWLIAFSSPSLHLNQCCHISDSALLNKFQWNLNLNITILIQENTFENVVCKMASILSQCVHALYLPHSLVLVGYWLMFSIHVTSINWFDIDWCTWLRNVSLNCLNITHYLFS